MIHQRILAAVALLCVIGSQAQAQKTKATLNTEINVNFPDNLNGFITPALARPTYQDIVNSIMPNAPVVSGNLACFNGITGLLQDCGTVPIPAITCAASNWVNSLVAGVLICSRPNFTDLAGSIAAGQIPSATITGAMLTANAAVALSQLAAQNNNTVVGNVSGGSATPVALTGGQVGSMLCIPQRSVFITGTSLTYTTPTCNGVTATWLEADVQGGGGGGGGSGTGTSGGIGTAGNASSFGGLTAAGGGAGPSTGSNSGGVGGACSGSLGTQQNFPGSAGTGLNGVGATAAPGGSGGVSFYGGGGVGIQATAGGAAPVNSGGGGSGGGGSATTGVFNGNGGGAGCHIKTIITSPAATFTYSVGSLATGGNNGTSGFGGGNGAAGLIDIIAHWQ